MSKVIVRHRLVTWFEEFEDKFAPGGVNRREQLAHKGQEVDIPDEERARIVGVNTDYDPPFYSDEDAEKIREGSYQGPDAQLLFAARAGQRPASPVQPVDGEGSGSLRESSTEQLAEYISENRLTVQETLALLPEDATEDDVNKLLDAETIASESDPRAGVVKTLEARLTAL